VNLVALGKWRMIGAYEGRVGQMFKWGSLEYMGVILADWGKWEVFGAYVSRFGQMPQDRLSLDGAALSILFQLKQIGVDVGTW
jgi:hypothetical protein